MAARDYGIRHVQRWNSAKRPRGIRAIKDSLFASRLFGYIHILESPRSRSLLKAIAFRRSVHGYLLRNYLVHSPRLYSLASLPQYAWFLDKGSSVPRLSLVACRLSLLAQMLGLQSQLLVSLVSAHFVGPPYVHGRLLRSHSSSLQSSLAMSLELVLQSSLSILSYANHCRRPLSGSRSSNVRILVPRIPTIWNTVVQGSRVSDTPHG